MKFLVVFFVFAIAALRDASGEIVLPPEVIELLKSVSEVCQKESGVDPAIVEAIRKTKLSEDPKAKCYLKCMFRQFQAMKEDGSLDTDIIEATMPDSLKEYGGMETVHKCKHIKEPDLCETAYKLIVCFQKENPTLTAMFE